MVLYFYNYKIKPVVMRDCSTHSNKQFIQKRNDDLFNVLLRNVQRFCLNKTIIGSFSFKINTKKKKKKGGKWLI